MHWLTAVGYGAVGGAVVESINFFGVMTALQQARNEALQRREVLPRLREQVDVFVGVVVALSRLGLGAFAGFIFHEQISGPYAAIVVGAAAPAILKQLNTVPNVRVTVQAGSEDARIPPSPPKLMAERLRDAGNGKHANPDDSPKLPNGPATPELGLDRSSAPGELNAADQSDVATKTELAE